MMRLLFTGSALLWSAWMAAVVLVDPGRAAEATWRVGFAKSDITPTEPVRLSGYASRTGPHQGVADRLFARAMVVQSSGGEEPPLVLVSLDAIMVTRGMTAEVAQWVRQRHGVPRSHLVLASTHSHAAPHLDGGLENLFSTPLSDSEQEASRQYTRRLIGLIQETIDHAMAERRPANIALGEGRADFAVNRRLLRDGKWVGFGEHLEGVVDRRVRVWKVTTPEGALLGGAFMYACHCTTLGAYEKVSGDWAGLAASGLEAEFSGTVFLPVIGCGADANPHPRGTYELAQQHAAEMIAAVRGVLQGKALQTLTAAPVAHFGYAGLAPEQPTPERLQEMARSPRSNERNWAAHMERVRREMGRLPETVPMPIHVWRFGDELNWVFLGGEVVVDYQFAIEKELPGQRTWVAAYCDDVFAYVASEAMRAEGGYEVDSSMIYYLQPGRWQSGTQSLIVRRVIEISRGQATETEPLSAQQSLQSIRVPPDFVVELVAGEPLVQDPINVAFAADGRVWVVEMGDYPLGSAVGGRVRWLRDTDGDGRMDESHVFVEGLEFPTSVHPWRGGVLIISAPDILYAVDEDEDGRADRRDVLLTGIHRANPQHRASGFEIGLDGWLHFSPGDGTRQLTNPATGQQFDLHGGDVAWNPGTGELVETSGHTQFVRARDDFGHWFGNSNSRPMYQYVVERRYLAGRSFPGSVVQDLLDPAIAPPVFPRSLTQDRFNDLFARNRFTSACSAIIGRALGVRQEGEQVAFVCEPVHNLVSRLQLSMDPDAYRARRHPDDTEFDFFTSTDPWSRPVRAVTAPDGTLWVVDMVRRVIEHPEWIPTAWQQQLDLRAGQELGRIYRVYRRGYRPLPLPAMRPDPASVLPELASQVGPRRDLAMQVIVQQGVPVQREVRRLSREHRRAEVRASALGCLVAAGWSNPSDVLTALSDAHPEVVCLGLRMSERLPGSNALYQAITAVVPRDLGPHVDLQWVLTVARRGDIDAADRLLQIARRSGAAPWVARSFWLVDNPELAFPLVQSLLESDSWSATGNEDQPWRNLANRAELVRRLWLASPVQPRRQWFADQLQVRGRTADATTAAPGPLWVAVLAAEPPDQLDEGLRAIGRQWRETLRRQITDAATPVAMRRNLLWLWSHGLASEQDLLQAADEILATPGLSDLHEEVVASLRQLDSPDVAEVMLRHWHGLSLPVQSMVSTTLLTRRTWATAFVAALESGAISPQELAPATVQQWRQYGDRGLRARAEQVLGKPTSRSSVVARILREMPAPQDHGRGGELFVQHCAVCHATSPQRPPIGPPLDNLRHWTIDQWVHAIFDPNASVEPKYRQSKFLTDADEVITGVVIQRSPLALQIAQADGTVRLVPAQHIVREETTSVSLMPDGFESKLRPADVAELIGYLRSR
ncbi:MAG: hypothetical protein D6753_00255 [Planctomycetota bacterium]|nr:MAG: hypothetical protein D6753_00255 [Planctomycetota bacterium]